MCVRACVRVRMCVHMRVCVCMCTCASLQPTKHFHIYMQSTSAHLTDAAGQGHEHISALVVELGVRMQRRAHLQQHEAQVLFHTQNEKLRHLAASVSHLSVWWQGYVLESEWCML